MTLLFSTLFSTRYILLLAAHSHGCDSKGTTCQFLVKRMSLFRKGGHLLWHHAHCTPCLTDLLLVFLYYIHVVLPGRLKESGKLRFVIFADFAILIHFDAQSLNIFYSIEN